MSLKFAYPIGFGVLGLAGLEFTRTMTPELILNLSGIVFLWLRMEVRQGRLEQRIDDLPCISGRPRGGRGCRGS